MLPYLKFSYTVNLVNSNSTSTLAPFTSVFALPEVYSQKMVPSINGFKFDNDFKGYPLPFTVPPLPGLPDIPPDYGLCGGMSSAAYDFYLAGRTIPTATAAPDNGTPLQSYLLKRSMDTFGPAGSTLLRVAQLTGMPDDGPNGILTQNIVAFQDIKDILNSSRAVVMGLIYQSASTPAELLQRIWGNHQVLALSYSENPDGTTDVHILDPNFHQNDQVFIHLEPVIVTGGLSGLKCTQMVSGKPLTYETVRGITIMTYEFVDPPAGL